MVLFEFNIAVPVTFTNAQVNVGYVVRAFPYWSYATAVNIGVVVPDIKDPDPPEITIEFIVVVLPLTVNVNKLLVIEL
jgi:hypothetical protein